MNQQQFIDEQMEYLKQHLRTVDNFVERYNRLSIERRAAPPEIVEQKITAPNMRSRKNLLTLWKWFVGKFIRRVR